MNSVISLLAVFGALSLGVGAVMLVVGIMKAPDGRETDHGLELAPTTDRDHLHDVSADHMHVA